jgi:hypothetical protein
MAGVATALSALSFQPGISLVLERPGFFCYSLFINDYFARLLQSYKEVFYGTG